MGLLPDYVPLRFRVILNSILLSVSPVHVVASPSTVGRGLSICPNEQLRGAPKINGEAHRFINFRASYSARLLNLSMRNLINVLALVTQTCKHSQHLSV